MKYLLSFAILITLLLTACTIDQPANPEATKADFDLAATLCSEHLAEAAFLLLTHEENAYLVDAYPGDSWPYRRIKEQMMKERQYNELHFRYETTGAERGWFQHEPEPEVRGHLVVLTSEFFPPSVEARGGFFCMYAAKEDAQEVEKVWGTTACYFGHSGECISDR